MKTNLRHPNGKSEIAAKAISTNWVLHMRPGESLLDAIPRHRRETGWQGGLFVVPAARN